MRLVRRQVPGGAVEQVGARVLARRAARSRRAGGRRRSARRRAAAAPSPSRRRSRRSRRAPRRAPRRHRRRARRAAPRRTRRPRRRAPRHARRDRAAPRAEGSDSRTSAPRRSRAARAIEPPISPTPTTATFTPRRRTRLAGDRGGLLDLRRRTSANSEPRSCCGPSQIASSGCGWTSTMMPSAPAAAAARRQRLDEVAPPRGVRRVDDHRQVAELLEHRDRREVEREAVGGLERADAALAQHDVSLPSLRMYSAAISSSSSVLGGRA